MRIKFALLLLLVMLLSACSTATPAPAENSVPVETGIVTIISPTATLVTGTARSEATATILLPTPTATAIPPLTFEVENYQDFTATIDFNGYLLKVLNQKVENVEYKDFAVTPNGQTFAVWGCIYNCSLDSGGKHFLAVVNMNDPAKLRLIEISWDGTIRDLALSPDGEYLYFSIGREVFRYDMATWNILRVYTTNESESSAFLGISPDGKLLAVSNALSLKIISLPGNTISKTIGGTFFGNWQAAQFSGDGRFLVIPTKDTLSEMTVYETSTWTKVRVFDTPNMKRSDLSPDGKILAQAFTDPAVVRFIDVETGNLLHSTSIPLSRISRVAFNPSGTLLVVVGSPGDTAFMEETIRIIDVQSGTELDPIPSWIEPFTFWFAESGKSILFTNYLSSMLEKWSLPNADVLAARDFVMEYFEAINAGNYEKAAEMTTLDEYDIEEVQNRGLDPGDLAQAFAILCEQDEVPCLPLGDRLYVKATNLWGWDYSALVTLRQPDGSTVIFEGISPYGVMGIKLDPQGNMKINTLHPGMLYPYME